MGVGLQEFFDIILPRILKAQDEGNRQEFVRLINLLIEVLMQSKAAALNPDAKPLDQNKLEGG